MVTASDGSPTRVTSRPLNAPAARPTIAMTTKMAIIGQCLLHRNPSRQLDMPSVDETDRSISPLMMINVIGSAMIAISPLDRPRLNRLLLVRKFDEAATPATPMITTIRARPASQRKAHGALARRLASPGRDGPGGVSGATSGGTASTP